jgi:hypothetical protein
MRAAVAHPRSISASTPPAERRCFEAEVRIQRVVLKDHPTSRRAGSTSDAAIAVRFTGSSGSSPASSRSSVVLPQPMVGLVTGTARPRQADPITGVVNRLVARATDEKAQYTPRYDRF